VKYISNYIQDIQYMISNSIESDLETIETEIFLNNEVSKNELIKEKELLNEFKADLLILFEKYKQ